MTTVLTLPRPATSERVIFFLFQVRYGADKSPFSHLNRINI